MIERDAGSGTIAGIADGELLRFRGVPYAAAPVGELRFAAPLPHPGWRGVRDARFPGPTPLLPPESQDSSIPEPATAGEEILNLNITAPADLRGPAPVYVWIHGGGYTAGSPNGGWFDGATLARSGVVVVSITYRLGFEGFGHIPGAVGNRGLLDCLAALEWVRDHIAGFGGDPGRVTVGGQSAGGGLVLSLLASPRGRGLFRAAVAHSAPIPDIAQPDAERVATTMARELGVPQDLTAWQAVPRTAIVAAERRLQESSLWSDLNQVRAALSYQEPLTTFGPVVGTELVPAVLTALREPDTRPVMLGSTAAEFNRTVADLDARFGWATARPLLTAMGVHPVLARAYPRAYPDLSVTQLLGQALTNRAFRLAAVRVAAARADAGTPAALWDFRWHPQDGIARHCIDLPFAWDALDGDRVDRIAGEDPPSSLAQEMSGDIASFIHTAANPWPGYTPAQPRAKVYDTPTWVGADPYRFERVALGVE